MGDGRRGAGVEATVAVTAKHTGCVVLFEIGLCWFLLWDGGSGGIVEGVLEKGGEGGTGSVVCEDVGFEEGDGMFEAGEFLHGVDPAGVAVEMGSAGKGGGGWTDWSSRRWRSDSWPLASW